MSCPVVAAINPLRNAPTSALVWGINIRDRSSKLTLSYRTTQEILGAAVRLLGEEEWDDLDDRRDDLTGYRSVLRGRRPSLVPYATWDAELDGLVEQVLAWNDVAKSSIAICVPERHMVAEVENRLGRAGIVAAAIGPEGPRLYDAIHVGTMHRFKGLEYQRMIIAGVADGLVPTRHVEQFDAVDPLRYRRESQRARSLLFVAATRARDTVVISWHGQRADSSRKPLSAGVAPIWRRREGWAFTATASPIALPCLTLA